MVYDNHGSSAVLSVGVKPVSVTSHVPHFAPACHTYIHSLMDIFFEQPVPLLRRFQASGWGDLFNKRIPSNAHAIVLTYAFLFEKRLYVSIRSSAFNKSNKKLGKYRKHRFLCASCDTSFIDLYTYTVANDNGT